MFARDRLHGREGRGDGQTKRIIPSPIAAPPLFIFLFLSHHVCTGRSTHGERLDSTAAAVHSNVHVDLQCFVRTTKQNTCKLETKLYCF
jgi:hypothetical protein